MDVDRDVIPSCNANQVGPDFADLFPSGYRFHPTDSELIVDYLNAKIESRELPKCRLHEVYIYNHTPEELAERYRSHDNTWYFLTSRDRKYPKGSRPDRVVGRKSGFWKATQAGKPVYDASRQVVGHKRSLAFFIDKEHKTSWLMHEYTANRPTLPFGSGPNSNKLNEWVLCEIYKNKQTTDVPLSKRRRVSENHESNVSNQPEHVEVEETNGHVGTHVRMMPPVETQRSAYEFDKRGPLTNTMESAPTWVNNADIVGQFRMDTFQGSSLFQAAPCYPSQFTSSASNDFQISDGVSQPLAELPIVHGLNSIQPVEREFSQNMFPSTACNGIHQFPNGALGSSSMEPRNYGGYTTVLGQITMKDDVHQEEDIQDGSTQSIVVCDQDDADHSSQPAGYDAEISAPNEFFDWSVEYLERLADENPTPFEIDC